MRDQLLEIWHTAAQNVVSLCEPLTDEQWHAVTPCPNWTVADIVAHLIDVQSMVAGDARPDVNIDWEKYPHATSELDRVNEIGVEFRRGQTKDVTLAEYLAILQRRLDQIQHVYGDVLSPLGNTISIERLLSMLIFDTWVHEQDIRIAIDQPGGMDSPAAHVAANIMFGGVAKAWGKSIAPGVGKTLRVTVTGPDMESDATYVIDERGHAVACESEVADVHLVMSWPDYFLIAAGRIDPLDSSLRNRIRVLGEPDLVNQTLREINVAV